METKYIGVLNNDKVTRERRTKKQKKKVVKIEEARN